MLIGTVSYLAPELVVDGRADARADVYAAGVVLYELLTGAKPHEGESPIQVAYKHVHEDVPAAVRARCPASRRTSTRWSPAPPPATAACGRPTPACCCTSCTGSATRSPTAWSTTPSSPPTWRRCCCTRDTGELVAVDRPPARHRVRPVRRREWPP